MIVLDTNVISEALRPTPETAVLEWLRLVPRRELWTSTVVVGELFSGVELMPKGERQQLLRDKMELLVSTLFSGRILVFDLAAARAYGLILANRQSIGRPIGVSDAQIAAITLVHKATLATRNTRDFEYCGIELANPWLAG